MKKQNVKVAVWENLNELYSKQAKKIRKNGESKRSELDLTEVSWDDYNDDDN